MKYTTLLLGLATVLASITAAQARAKAHDSVMSSCNLNGQHCFRLVLWL